MTTYTGKGIIDGRAVTFTVDERGIKWVSKGLFGLGEKHGSVPRSSIASAELVTEVTHAHIRVETSGGKRIKITPKWSDKTVVLDALNGF
jgi:hypothetical protein